MTTATIFEAKTNLSELIKRAQAGEKVIITSGREKTPVAEISPLGVQKPQRLGFLTHLNLPDIPDSVWFDPIPDEWTGELDVPGDPLLMPLDAPVAKSARESRRKLVSK
jgi:antitoxin (DNA-binding transcriptional repressor) of toxin-antitoxin stability system